MSNNARKHAVNDKSRFSFLSGFWTGLSARANAPTNGKYKEIL